MPNFLSTNPDNQSVSGGDKDTVLRQDHIVWAGDFCSEWWYNLISSGIGGLDIDEES